jgi:predicted DNA-binding protein
MEKKMIGIRISAKEKKILDAYSEQEERSQTEIIREFIRSLEAKIKKDGEQK